jgi:hypothetical protein
MVLNRFSEQPTLGRFSSAGFIEKSTIAFGTRFKNFMFDKTLNFKFTKCLDIRLKISRKRTNKVQLKFPHFDVRVYDFHHKDVFLFHVSGSICLLWLQSLRDIFAKVVCHLKVNYFDFIRIYHNYIM